MKENQSILKEYTMGDLKLANRLVMAPMTRSRANNPGRVPTKLIAEHYAQRASAGLIITEGSQISPRAVGYINTPGIYSEEQVEGWKEVTKAVHENGGTIRLCEASESAAYALQVTRMDQVFSVYDTEKEAVESFQEE